MSAGFCLAPEAVRGMADAGLSRDAHAGLYWTHYLPMWEGSPERPARPAVVKGVLQAFAGGFNARGQGARNRPRDLLRLHRERMERALAHRERVQGWVVATLSARVTWRLVAGLGSEHPTEVNLAFDPLIGVPYLAGTAVKGLCRRAAQALDRPQEKIARLFGPTLAEAQARPAQGAVTFFDAFPRRWPELVVDIVNTHHQGYLSERIKEPVETETPVPVYFLAVAEGAEFVFHLAAGKGRGSDLAQAKELLARGLATLGMGGKTALGYGVMSQVG